MSKADRLLGWRPRLNLSSGIGHCIEWFPRPCGPLRRSGASPLLVRTLCPLGGSAGADEELYPASCDPEALTPETFRARREADRIHYRMVRNRGRAPCEPTPF